MNYIYKKKITQHESWIRENEEKEEEEEEEEEKGKEEKEDIKTG